MLSSKYSRPMYKLRSFPNKCSHKITYSKTNAFVPLLLKRTVGLLYDNNTINHLLSLYFDIIFQNVIWVVFSFRYREVKLRLKIEEIEARVKVVPTYTYSILIERKSQLLNNNDLIGGVYYHSDLMYWKKTVDWVQL